MASDSEDFAVSKDFDAVYSGSVEPDIHALDHDLDASLNMLDRTTVAMPSDDLTCNNSASAILSTPARSNRTQEAPDDRYTTPVCIRIESGSSNFDDSCCPVCLVSFEANFRPEATSADAVFTESKECEGFNASSQNVQNGPDHTCSTPGENSTVLTRCRHKFHSKCLQQAKQLVRPECPICRGKLTPPSNSEIRSGLDRAAPNIEGPNTAGHSSRQAIIAAASRGRNAVRAALMRRQAQMQ